VAEKELFHVDFKGSGIGRSDPGIMAAPMPSSESEAISVVFLPTTLAEHCLWHALLLALAQRGA
jgi:hypothetical protein